MYQPRRGLARAILGLETEACDCSAVMGIRAFGLLSCTDGSNSRGGLGKSDLLFLLECCLVPASKYHLVA